MDIRKLQRAIVDGLEDVKAQNIVVFNTEHLSALFERVIIASGTSNRQTKALAASVRDSVKSRGMQVMATEGEDNGEWIIVDCGAAVAHIMQPSIREYYHLEEIWGGKPVRMKVGEVKTTLVKASEPEPARNARPSAVAGGAAQPQPGPAASRPQEAARRASAAVKPASVSRPAAGQATAVEGGAGSTASPRRHRRRQAAPRPARPRPRKPRRARPRAR